MELMYICKAFSVAVFPMDVVYWICNYILTMDSEDVHQFNKNFGVSINKSIGDTQLYYAMTSTPDIRVPIHKRLLVHNVNFKDLRFTLSWEIMTKTEYIITIKIRSQETTKRI